MVCSRNDANGCSGGWQRPLLYMNYHRPWFADYQPGGQLIVRHKHKLFGR